MHYPREFGNGTLTQRQPRDEQRGGQVTIDFGQFDEDYDISRNSIEEQESDSKYEKMRLHLLRRTSRLSVLLVFLLFVCCYLFLFNSTEPNFDDINIDVEAIERDLERDLESDDRIKFMTYQPLTFLPPEGQKNGMDKLRGKTKDKETEQEHENKEENKYHAMWTWANASITIHEFFPDTPDVGLVLEALATAPIIKVDNFGPVEGNYEAGTSEKWLVTLDGGQQALVKLAWEEKFVMKNNALCNYGYEMPWSEVAAFHLHRVLGFRNTPYVVGRKIDLVNEILPHASPSVKAQFSNKDGKTCVTGTCHFCKEPTTLCPRDGIVTASVAYWVPRKLKLYTYPPHYMPYSTPSMEEWSKVPFNNKTYCDKIRNDEPYNVDRYYHDLFDFAVVDALSYHYDSKHYIIDDNSNARGLTVRLDHGRAFCASDRDDEGIFLAPIFQCCTIRWETWWALQGLMKGALRRELSQALATDTTWGDLLHEEHLVAIERRFKKVLDLVERCVAANGAEYVFVG